MSLALALHGRSLLRRPRRRCWGCFSLASRDINLSLHAIFVQALIVARARSGAGRPVRYRAEQHAARPVHVSRRRSACGDELSLQRNDESVRQSHSAMAPARPISSRPVSLRNSIRAASGEMILSEIVNTQAGEIDHDRPRLPRAADRCPGRSSRWPAAAPSCWWRTSPSARTRKPGSAIWRAMTNSPNCPTGSISATRSDVFWQPSRASNNCHRHLAATTN